MDEAGRSMLRQRLYSVGELLRMNQIVPESATSAVNDVPNAGEL